MVEIQKDSRREYIRKIREAADRLEPKLRDRFLETVDNIQSTIVLRRLAEQIELGRPIDTTSIERAFQGLASEAAGMIAVGGSIAASHATDVLKPRQTPIGGFEVRFNVFNESTAQFTNQYQQTLIRQITDDTRVVIEQITDRGVRAGKNPIDIARDIRDNIGLTAKQEMAVSNYRKYLENLDSAALNRELRDRRFDSTISRAINNKNPLSQERIDRMVTRYRERYVKHRAEMIGRTEAMRAVNAGDKLLWEQAVEDGQVNPEQIRRQWVYTHDGNTRPEHVAIPRMNEGGVGINEPFQSPLGPIMFPHDPGATASNTIGCRCTVFTRVVSMELL